jgi:hypothetical protein
MIEIQIVNEKRFLPESFDELTTDQFIKYIEMIHTIKDIHEFRIKYLVYVLDLNVKFLNKHPFALEQIIQEVMPYLDWIEQSQCQKILIPYFDTASKRYFAPADRLDSFSAEELDSASTLYDIAIETDSIEDLANFVAVLYRPTLKGIKPGTQEWKGDYRMPYNSNNILLHGKDIQTLDYFVLKAILINFQMIMNLYYNAPQYESIFKSGSTGNNEPTDWNRIYRTLVPDITDVNHLLQMPIYKVFDELVYLEEQREYLENQKK